MKISKEARKKAEEIKRQIQKENKEEIEMEEARSFAKQYGICPQCAIPLSDVKCRISFFKAPSFTEPTIKRCKKCGFEVVLEETYY